LGVFILEKEGDQMNATCDQCSKELLIDIKEQNVGKGIVETYFHCSHCNHRYSVTFTNGIIRDRIIKFSKEWAKMSRLKNGKEWNKKVWMKKYEKLQAYKTATDAMINKLKEENATSS
jgi:transcription elongation factor Elf1